MPVDIAKLRDGSPHTEKFLEFEREVEGSIRQEDDDRRREIEDEKRAREKKARRKRTQEDASDPGRLARCSITRCGLQESSTQRWGSFREMVYHGPDDSDGCLGAASAMGRVRSVSGVTSIPVPASLHAGGSRPCRGFGLGRR